MSPAAASRRPWLRLAAWVVASIPLGGLTTLAVAWGVALIGIKDPPAGAGCGGGFVMPGGKRALVVWEIGHGATWTKWHFSDADVSLILPERQEVLIGSEGYHSYTKYVILKRIPDGVHPPQAPGAARREIQLGWPARAMWAAMDWRGEGCSIEDLGDPHLWRLWPAPSVSRSTPFQRDRTATVSPAGTIPTGILPRGFALNTGFYAGSWLLLLSLPAALRHTLRRRRAQCESCGYPHTGLAPSAACPECGAQTPAPAAKGTLHVVTRPT